MNILKDSENGLLGEHVVALGFLLVDHLQPIGAKVKSFKHKSRSNTEELLFLASSRQVGLANLVKRLTSIDFVAKVWFKSV